MQRYQDAELAEIGSFLTDSYVKASNTVRSAKRRKPREAAEAELKRLRKKEAEGASRAVLNDADIKELEDALDSPLFEEFDSTRREALEKLAREEGKVADTQRPRSFAYFVLLAASKRLCAKAAVDSKGKSYVISNTSLAALFVTLHFAPWLAPAVVWIATKLRDFGQGVFCDALESYLQQDPPPV